MREYAVLLLAVQTLRAVEALVAPLEQLRHPSLTGFALAAPAVEGQTSALVAEVQRSVLLLVSLLEEGTG